MAELHAFAATCTVPGTVLFVRRITSLSITKLKRKALLFAESVREPAAAAIATALGKRAREKEVAASVAAMQVSASLAVPASASAVAAEPVLARGGAEGRASGSDSDSG